MSSQIRSQTFIESICWITVSSCSTRSSSSARSLSAARRVVLSACDKGVVREVPPRAPVWRVAVFLRAVVLRADVFLRVVVFLRTVPLLGAVLLTVVFLRLRPIFLRVDLARALYKP